MRVGSETSEVSRDGVLADGGTPPRGVRRLLQWVALAEGMSTGKNAFAPHVNSQT
jgi:hypothetical protein